MESIGIIQYADYLRSSEWRKIKSKVRKRAHYQMCWLCDSKQNLEIHHRSYKWIGTKDAMRGLVAVCRDCHQRIHDYAKEHSISVRLATNRLKKPRK